MPSKTGKSSSKIVPKPGRSGAFVIAEIGKNFIISEQDESPETYLKRAKDLIRESYEAGADAVKFQTHHFEDEQIPEKIFSPHFNGADRYNWVLRNSRLTPIEFWREIKNYADHLGIQFFITPMSRGAVRKVADLSLPFWKIGSGDVTDFLMIDELAKFNKPIIISTGMVSLKELDKVVSYIRAKGVRPVIMYCVSKYPAPKEAFNLGTIEFLKEKYPDLQIGFSDHSVDNHDIALSAVALGASLIEKHVSYSRDHWGPDHKASLTFAELRELVEEIRSGTKKLEVGDFYGSKGKELAGATSEFRPFFRKAFVAARDIKKGEVITLDNILAMRPALLLGGIPSEDLTKVVGKKANCGIKKLNPIKAENLN
ncbi:MAG: N-acetylneuraminate synthase family protein [Candidatus Paceibacterota bacterium]|jgi:sialic acid synthase SpsE